MLFTGLTVQLEPGDGLAVRGANGSGKSTLLRVLAGFGAPAAGRVVASVDGTTPVPPEQASVLLGHADGVKTALTVAENLSFWARLYGAKPDTSPLMDRLYLNDLADLPARYLSAGQRRRLALSRMLLSARPVWLLDEPSTALDKDATALLEEIIAGHRAQGGIAVVALHGALDLPHAQTCRIGPVQGGLTQGAAP